MRERLPVSQEDSEGVAEKAVPATSPGGMHRKKRPAGQRGSLFKGRDAAGRPPGLVPPTTMACGAFRAMLARRSQRGLRFFGYTLLRLKTPEQKPGSSDKSAEKR